jgi:hypothetical protein
MRGQMMPTTMTEDFAMVKLVSSAILSGSQAKVGKLLATRESNINLS